MTFAISDLAPTGPELDGYDEAHLRLYLRLLDAEAAGAPWDEVARLLLGRDPEFAKSCYDSHLARARWVADKGYLDLLRSGKT